MLQVMYLCFILLRLTRKDISHRARVGLFSRRFAGLAASFVLFNLLFGWSFGLWSLLLLWGPIALGEWAALQYALEKRLPGASPRRLPLY